MRTIISIVSMAAMISLVMQGCYYTKADQVYPQPVVCDTVNMRYSADVVPILAANCYTCHGGLATNSGGRKFDRHDLLKNYVDNGKLRAAITHSAGASPMPKNLPRLPDCTINKILAWIDRGALNN